MAIARRHKFSCCAYKLGYVHIANRAISHKNCGGNISPDCRYLSYTSMFLNGNTIGISLNKIAISLWIFITQFLNYRYTGTLRLLPRIINSELSSLLAGLARRRSSSARSASWSAR